jgi:hypothetical protein
MYYSIRTLFILLFISMMGVLYAAPDSRVEEQQANPIISSLYDKLNQEKTLPMPDRLDKISGIFLQKPYYLGALGEGLAGRYDQYPLYRADAFDCLTFVETVLAIALAHDLTSFQKNMKHIRYQDGKVSYITRNHFTDLDWNPNNQRQGFLEDITTRVRDEQQHPIAQMAEAEIDKPSWYQHITVDRIRLVKPDADAQKQRLDELIKKGQSFPLATARIPYLPLTALFDADGEPKERIFKQIPNGVVIEIIRPNWDLRDKIGSHLNVSHLGFGFWHDGVLIFRNASTLKGQVVDQSLAEYLRATLQSPTIKGINIQIVRSPD